AISRLSTVAQASHKNFELRHVPDASKHDSARGLDNAATGNRRCCVVTMFPVSLGTALAALLCARSGALATVHSTATIGHRRCHPASARLGPSPATRRGREIARRIAVSQPAVPV